MTLIQRLFIHLAVIVVGWVNIALAEDASPPAVGSSPQVLAPPRMPPNPVGPRPMVDRFPPPTSPMVEKIKPGLYALGQIQIDKKFHSISFPAEINMRKGLLEYLLVRRGGKTHESLFRTNVEPTQLQLAMLLLGAEGSDMPLARQGDPATPQGSPVEVSAVYTKEGQKVQIRPEDWIAKTGMASGEPLHWVFAGSKVSNGRFMAQLEGSIIALYHDPVALIDNASPGGESNRIWFVNEATVPPVGTPVTLTITVKN